MTTYNFDFLPSRRDTDSGKWRTFPEDVVPMWVADMDFVSPQPVIDALRDYASRGVFGYPAMTNEGIDAPGLREAVVARLARRYSWQVDPEALVFVPGVIIGFNLAAHLFARPGGELLTATPNYGPILAAAAHAGLTRRDAPLARAASGRYEIDWDVFEGGFNPATVMFLLCNPHNPVGRVYTADELARMAEACRRHGVPIVSDEIHSDLVYSGQRHVPIASLSPEIEQNSITLIAPSKTFNLAGMQCSVAIIPNAELRARYIGASGGLVPWVNAPGLIAAEAAYRYGDEWLGQLLPYLEGNRDLVTRYVAEHMPGVSVYPAEATYLAWLDCRGSGLSQPCQCFLDLARVACSAGEGFGPGGEGFVRLNFGCPRPMLVEALERMRAVLPRPAELEGETSQGTFAAWSGL